jgi:hypothetical protein
MFGQRPILSPNQEHRAMSQPQLKPHGLPEWLRVDEDETPDRAGLRVYEKMAEVIDERGTGPVSELLQSMGKTPQSEIFWQAYRMACHRLRRPLNGVPYEARIVYYPILVRSSGADAFADRIDEKAAHQLQRAFREMFDRKDRRDAFAVPISMLYRVPMLQQTRSETMHRLLSAVFDATRKNPPGRPPKIAELLNQGEIPADPEQKEFDGISMTFRLMGVAIFFDEREGFPSTLVDPEFCAKAGCELSLASVSGNSGSDNSCTVTADLLVPGTMEEAQSTGRLRVARERLSSMVEPYALFRREGLSWVEINYKPEEKSLSLRYGDGFKSDSLRVSIEYGAAAYRFVEDLAEDMRKIGFCHVICRVEDKMIRMELPTPSTMTLQ